LASWRKNGCARLPGHEKLKDHQKPMLERRAIIARRLVQAARAVVLSGPTILLSHEAAEWKKILSARAENLPSGQDVAESPAE
jgi:hypothetical protein